MTDREGRPTTEAGRCFWHGRETGCECHVLAAAGALPSVEDRVRSEISGMRLALSAMDDSATVDNARYRIGRVIEGAEREVARLASSKEDRPEDDPISDSRQPEDGPPPGRWPR